MTKSDAAKSIRQWDEFHTRCQVGDKERRKIIANNLTNKKQDDNKKKKTK